MKDGVLVMRTGGDLVSAPPSFREEAGLPYLSGKDGLSNLKSVCQTATPNITPVYGSCRSRKISIRKTTRGTIR